MLPLMADPLLPFTSLLLALAFSFFFSSSSSHNLCFSFPITILSSQNFLTHYLLRSVHLQCHWRKVIVLLAVKGRRLPPIICLPKPWVERLPILNWTVPRRRNGVAIQVVSALLLLTHGTTPICTSPWCPAITHLLHQDACGFPFAVMIPKSLGLLWLPPFLTLISTKEPHYSCPFPSNLGQVHL